ncbi:MAG: hypothetical protein JO316_21650 [Abitibacteriaceae bacterium]|nr:hypothetical protein [Abditibacteriaceae bacterium]MBV9867969.1 hypothetical protein [Abditibacteriaceae bacterium]
MEHELKQILNTGEVPADLVISYDDMHGLWGGTTIMVRGTGSVERLERPCGAKEPTRFQAQVPPGHLLSLIELLVQLAAWQQKTPGRQPVPDESRATLTINVGGQSSRLWEWFNELEQNSRLVKIKEKMEELIRQSR